mgnify:CR=1 FL=1
MSYEKDIETAVNPIANAASELEDTLRTSGLAKNDDALAGLQELIDKLEPLLAGRRLNRVVDLMSIAADLVDMTDSYMIEKVVKATDDGVGAMWTVGNAARMAEAQITSVKEPPSLLGLLRMTRQSEVRRGLAFLLAFTGILGRQLRYDELDRTSE